MEASSLDQRVQRVRQFNRFITREIGALQEGLVHSSFSLTEVRVMYELAHRKDLTAAELTKELGLDPGYLSRILSKLEQLGLIGKDRSEKDGRRMILQLTEQGEKAYAPLNRRSNEEVEGMLADLGETEQARLLKAMQTIEELLAKDYKYAQPFILRSLEPGDIGMIIHMHGRFYSREYGWDERFEASVSQIAAQFLQNFNPNKERCWIAEMGGEIIGSIMVVQDNEEAARIRLLLVDPKARGMGLGTKLVEEALSFAKRTGYREMILWTNHVLTEARSIYRKLGFERIAEEKHNSFGPELIGETWRKPL
ncbi:bifunctional helix-turn-helix transcriptional regulator/GNAT family N-acetyltransferase [Gorillibacterium massiliense]|uniref:bifunctional helix-turn-helix transcriptional regulator/GNAT family N-acetyltransferase n=1 Tax=Gorillibacterium massiliense TaxID=1280390 RepID=UPI0004B41BCA|nr:helix-turn-helix domain-containing GNAT family N-acetyltransferase [Gorillibacterium massiliense]